MSYEVTAADVESGIRVDALGLREFPEIGSRAGARKALKRQLLLLDGEPARSAWFPREGQLLSFHPDRRLHPPNTLHPEVLFADDHLAVVVKPPGLLTNGNRHRTLERALPNVLPLLDRYPPHPVHRLDFETTGLVVCGRTAAAVRTLTERFQERSVDKRYRAIVVGRLEGEGRIELPLDEREACTTWRALAFSRSLKVEWCTEIEAVPVTGRMHQIRRHLTHLGHAVLGDRRYTTGPPYLGNGMFLASVGIGFEHPFTGERVEITMETPPKFAVFQAREDARWNRWHGRATVPPEAEEA